MVRYTDFQPLTLFAGNLFLNGMVKEKNIARYRCVRKPYLKWQAIKDRRLVIFKWPPFLHKFQLDSLNLHYYYFILSTAWKKGMTHTGVFAIQYSPTPIFRKLRNFVILKNYLLWSYKQSPNLSYLFLFLQKFSGGGGKDFWDTLYTFNGFETNIIQNSKFIILAKHSLTSK